MGGTIRVRFAHDLWWTEITYEKVLEWSDLNITYLTDDICFADIIDSNGGKTHVEINKSDYDKVINKKAFKLKFKLDKHKIL